MENGQHMTSEAENQPKEHPEIAEVNWIDDAFYVEKTRFMWKSVRKDTGRDFLFGIDEKSVTDMTRWHLKCIQDGSLDYNTRVVNDGVVGGKL